MKIKGPPHFLISPPALLPLGSSLAHLGFTGSSSHPGSFPGERVQTSTGPVDLGIIWGFRVPHPRALGLNNSQVPIGSAGNI